MFIIKTSALLLTDLQSNYIHWALIYFLLLHKENLQLWSKHALPDVRLHVLFRQLGFFYRNNLAGILLREIKTNSLIFFVLAE